MQVERLRTVLGVGAVLLALGGAAFAQVVEGAKSPQAEPPKRRQHRGPAVSPGEAGPARYAAAIYRGFQSDRAMKIVGFADQYYREPGNDGFEAVLDRVLAELRRMGFGEKPHLELRVIETELKRPAWTPVRAAIVAHPSEGEAQPILSFDLPAGDDQHRTLLPSYAASGTARGKVCFQLGDVERGSILVSDQAHGFLLRRARSKGAVAVVSARLAPFNVDPTGSERHLDAIRYSKVPDEAGLLTASISPRAYQRIRAMAKADATLELSISAEVKRDRRPLRTVVATVVGRDKPDEVIPIACHVQEPGAVDNASGIGGFVEAMRSLVRAIEVGTIDRPGRSVAVIWGDEMTQSRIYLEYAKRKVVAAFSADMIGASEAKTGAIALLERDPDPGALDTIPPDEHTPWGAGRTDESRIRPNGLSLITRIAMHDVATLAGGWKTAEHPWEGGSDHDIFLRKKIPALLVWHFTDFAYHTSLDRLEHVDPESLRRVSSALLSAALAIASPVGEDLPRYLESLAFDRELRTRAASEAGKPKAVERWERWFTGAEAWLRELCTE